MTETIVPDLTGISVYLATPAGDGNLHHGYVRGKDEMVASIEQFGGKCEWALLPHMSDLGLARATLLDSFVKAEKHTHMMLIDADMGFHGIDVVRMLYLKEDFIGAAGPMKNYPIKFAAVVMDDEMRPVPIDNIDWNTGVLEVHEVGMAFVLISRSCAEKMIETYKETLTFGAPGQPDLVDLFQPMIRGRRRYAEDFAFCRRWRDIGGTVKLLSDVALSHTGSHTFRGALMDSFLKGMQQNVQKAP